MTPAEVAAAGAAWVWLPPGATETVTDDYHLIVTRHAYQQVARFSPVRDPGLVAAEVLAAARATGRPELEWWVMPDAPPGTDELVRGLGGIPSTTLDLLALDLTDGPPLPGHAPDGIDVRMTTSVAGQRDFHLVSHVVFDEPLPTEEEVAADYDPVGHGRTFVAYDQGEPVVTAGVSVVDGVARLWSGCVLASHRRRGIYRAMLDARLAHAVGLGARFAMVRGRVETSAPLLRGAGFAAYGQQRGYRIAL